MALVVPCWINGIVARLDLATAAPQFCVHPDLMPDQVTRRRFLLGAASQFAAPAIVRASSLMPISPIEPIEALEPIRSTYYLSAEWLENHRFMANEFAPFCSRWEAEVHLSQGLFDGIDFDVRTLRCVKIERKKRRRRTSCWAHLPIQVYTYPLHVRELPLTPLREAVRKGDSEAIAILELLTACPSSPSGPRAVAPE